MQLTPYLTIETGDHVLFVNLDLTIRKKCYVLEKFDEVHCGSVCLRYSSIWPSDLLTYFSYVKTSAYIS